jgi:hypothetical protein
MSVRALLSRSALISSLVLLLQPLALAQQTTDWPIGEIATSSEILPGLSARDGSFQTFWSSQSHSSANRSEWIAYWFDRQDFHPVNYIKLRPRFDGDRQGFPIDFKVLYSNGFSWQQISAHINFPAPRNDDWVILPLPQTITTNGIQIAASRLSKDNLKNYVFQLAEIGAGYDPAYDQFRYVGNNGLVKQNEIQNVGSGEFSSLKLKNWNFDLRNPLISAKPSIFPKSRANIYAPSIVKNGDTWNIYFGGWDGTTDFFDRISLVTSKDNFNTFSPHIRVIDKNEYTHVNNASAIKLDNGQWLLYYTTHPNINNSNKPAMSISTNGLNWSPSSGTKSAALKMSGYPNWDNADVNGSNVIYYQDGIYYLYFDDFTRLDPKAPPQLGLLEGVYYATSSDGKSFTYRGIAVLGSVVANDVKSFASAPGTKTYLAGFHNNGGDVFYATSNTPERFPSAKVLFSSSEAYSDTYITSMGFVSDGKRLYGALYGAGPAATLDKNAIHAAWLQKKVIFKNDRGIQWGDVERAQGPDKIIMSMSTYVETGRFYVYDTDGTTLLYTSPSLTVKSGDIWRFSPSI